jgi:hypothetical protein
LGRSLPGTTCRPGLDFPDNLEVPSKVVVGHAGQSDDAATRSQRIAAASLSTLFENQAVRALRKIGHLMVAG